MQLRATFISLMANSCPMQFLEGGREEGEREGGREGLIEGGGREGGRKMVI